MPRRAIWSGSISFGLVNIPVKLFTAVKDLGIRFNMLHDQDKSRLRRKLVSERTGKEVHSEHIVKGFAVGKDRYVIVSESEMESCAPEKTRNIEITDFVDLADIDPIYYERPYYVVPEPAAAKSYRLLVQAMEKSQKIGIAKVVLHDKEHLAALRPFEDAICMEFMHFSDEIVPLDDVGGIPTETKVADRELKAAQQLIESLSTKFDPDKYHDEYRECILGLVQKKAKGEEIRIEPVAERKPSKATDLMAALEASLAQAKSQTRRKRSA